jgi:hypothetical protein
LLGNLQPVLLFWETYVVSAKQKKLVKPTIHPPGPQGTWYFAKAK